MISLKDGPNEVYKVRQFQHLDWGDGSVPKSEKSVLDLVERIQQSQQQAGNTSMVVQCR
jgi:protein tyrosine phosphatase